MYGTLTVLAVVMAYPLVWMFISAMKTKLEVYQDPWGLPERLEVENFSRAWEVGNLGTYLTNSIFVTTVSVLGILGLGSLAAFALARLRFRGSGFCFKLFLVGMIIPVQTFWIPLRNILGEVGLLNTYWALILPYIALELPIAIYILRAFFLNLPQELLDSARLDGCSSLSVYWHIALPMARPALMTVAILSTLTVWNELLMAILFIQDADLRTLPAGLLSFYTSHSVDLPLLFAGLTILALPMLLIYALFNRQIVEGVTAGALKG